jgi:carbon storage regulator
MLVISRKDGEQLVIGGNIIVTVVSALKGRVRLGFTAPAEIPILRQELQARLNGKEIGPGFEALEAT